MKYHSDLPVRVRLSAHIQGHWYNFLKRYDLDIMTTGNRLLPPYNLSFEPTVILAWHRFPLCQDKRKCKIVPTCPADQYGRLHLWTMQVAVLNYPHNYFEHSPNAKNTKE